MHLRHIIVTLTLTTLLTTACTSGQQHQQVNLEITADPPLQFSLDSLPEAFDRLRAWRQLRVTAPAIITLFPGRYTLTDPLVLNPSLIGDGLTIRKYYNAEPDSVILTGGRPIENLSLHHATGTWQTTIPDVANGDWWFEELFADLTPRTRARHPNTGYARVVSAGPDNRTSFTFNPDEIPAAHIDTITNTEVVFFHDWSTSRMTIADINTDTNTITLANPIGCKAPHYAITNFEKHPRFYIEGSTALVDTPGEWELDRTTGHFVYKPLPGETFDNTNLIAPVAPSLINIIGIHGSPATNVTLDGLTFAHSNWPIPSYGYAEGQAAFYEQRDKQGSDGTRDPVPAAIHLEWADNCTISNCTVSSVGGTGIWVGPGCNDNTISGTTVRHAGANGIMVGEPMGRLVNGKHWWQEAPQQAATGNTVKNCLVESCGRRFFGAVGIWVGLAQQTQVANCEVRDLPYTGISVGWRWDETPTPCQANIIESNHIHHVMLSLSDGGGIYTLGKQPGTVLRNNAIHDIVRNAGRAPSNGIFFDQGSTDLLIEGNFFWNIDTTPLRWHWTYQNVVRNNTFVIPEGQQFAYYNRAKGQDITYEDNAITAPATWDPTDPDNPAAAIIHHAGPQ
ncbi:MAG: right-handed parallel beta-helix repeat-containing protein [Planctomycetes bacterium]|nr:right-handed parallel beta-helix repeat-containing protein [Planctomycetota bacterium]NOG53485.1 right-handed parallel beta-helix repeat-containing protein [Planctomycetota bacterium]